MPLFRDSPLSALSAPFLLLPLSMSIVLYVSDSKVIYFSPPQSNKTPSDSVSSFLPFLPLSYLSLYKLLDHSHFIHSFSLSLIVHHSSSLPFSPFCISFRVVTWNKIFYLFSSFNSTLFYVSFFLHIFVCMNINVWGRLYKLECPLGKWLLPLSKSFFIPIVSVRCPLLNSNYTMNREKNW